MNIEQIMAKMSAIVARSDAEKRSLTDDEVVEYEGLEADLAKARKDVEVRSRHTAYTTPVTTPVVQTGDKSGDDTLERAFDHYLRTGQRNSDLVELRAQGTASDAAGGYLVPDGFRTRLIERMRSIGGMANHAETIVTESGSPLTWPTVDDNVSGEIVAEHATGTEGADIVFGTGSLGAYKYMSLGANDLPLRVSVELLQDAAFDVTGLLTRIMGKRIARAQAADFATGDGTGEPLGILVGTPDVVLASGDEITYAKLLDVVHSIDPDYREGAKWVFNDTTLKSVRLMEDGNQRPLWLPSTGGIGDSLPGGTLLGYPVVIDSSFPNVGDNVNFAAFGDIEEAYVIRRVRDVTLVVDPYGRAANGEVQFTAWARADGTIQNPNAYAILAGFDAA